MHHGMYQRNSKVKLCCQINSTSLKDMGTCTVSRSRSSCDVNVLFTMLFPFLVLCWDVKCSVRLYRLES